MSVILTLSHNMAMLLVLICVAPSSALMLRTAFSARSHQSRASELCCRGYTTNDAEETALRVQRVLQAKETSGKTFDQLAGELGLTNTYTAQLLLGQAQLKEATAAKLQQALPALQADDIVAMQGAPMRGFKDEILKEPNVYRTYEAITHCVPPLEPLDRRRA